MGAIRPLYHLQQFRRETGDGTFTDLARAVDMARAARGRPGGFPAWADWCFIPSPLLLGLMRLVRGLPPVPGDDMGVQDISAAARAAVFMTWRATQGIYRIDPVVFDALWETPLEGELPVESFRRLPEWCCYIEAPQGSIAWARGLRGFFVLADDLVPATAQEGGLVLLPDFADGGVQAPITLRLQPTGIDDSLREWLDAETADQFARQLIGPMLSTILYLCSENAEIGDGARPARPQPVRTKKGARYFPPPAPRTWNVAWRLGAALRAAALRPPAAADRGRHHAAPRPHIRRAHWHSYRLGPRDSATQRTVVKWLPPIAVNVADDAPVVPTIHPLR